eukprot:7471258-Pyramimonas_sp.AAC.1
MSRGAVTLEPERGLERMPVPSRAKEKGRPCVRARTGGHPSPGHARGLYNGLVVLRGLGGLPSPAAP